MPKEGWKNVTIGKSYYEIVKILAEKDHRSIPNFLELLIIKEKIRKDVEK